MSYSNIFGHRSNVRGSSVRGRKMHLKQRSFDKFFDSTLTANDVLIDGIKETVVIQDQTQNNNKDLSDDKYVVAKNMTKIHVGSVMEWSDRKWIFFSREEKTIHTHQQFKIRPSNYTMKFIDKNGDVCNGGKGVPSVIQNQTLYTLGVATGGNNAWIVNAKMLMYLVDDEFSKDIGIDTRVFIGESIYRIMFKDNVSRKGISHFLLEEEMINEKIDNIELQVADYYKYYDKDGNRLTNVESGNGSNTDTETGTTSNIRLEIDGFSDIAIGESQRYSIKIFVNDVEVQDDIESWLIVDDRKVVKINEKNGRYITIYAEDNFSNIDEMINIIAEYKGVIVNKTVTISSPY